MRKAPEKSSGNDSLPARKRPGRPSLQQSEELTGQILDEARRLFMKNGYSKTNLDRIVARLHLSKRTIYSRFPSKLELFLAVSEQIMNDHLDDLQNIELMGATPQEQLRHFALELARRLTRPELIALERAVMAEAHNFAELTNKTHICLAPFTLKTVANILSEINPLHGNSSEQLLEDAEIFVSLIASQLLRHKALHVEDERFTDKDERRLMRSVNIFINGYNREATA